MSATAECFIYDAIRLENIVISLHRVTTAFKTSGQGTAIVVGLLIELRHAGGIALVVALLDRLRALFPLTVGDGTRGATENRTPDRSSARIASDNGADDRSGHRPGDSVGARRRHRHYLHSLTGQHGRHAGVEVALLDRPKMAFIAIATQPVLALAPGRININLSGRRRRSGLSRRRRGSRDPMARRRRFHASREHQGQRNDENQCEEGKRSGRRVKGNRKHSG